MTLSRFDGSAMEPFDLTVRPWVVLHMLDGSLREVSLENVFRLASSARTVVGELPTTAFATMRLLLAILYRALGGAVTEESWGDLWKATELPDQTVADYLARFRDRFDLTSSASPFFQVADLRTANGEVSGLTALIADVPNGIPFQTTRSGRALQSIGLAEAARWVVHAQAFETSGIKSAAVGDDRVKNGKGYPIGTGWAGALGGVFAEGADLRETLLLNLVKFDPDPEAAPELPPWEVDPYSAAPSLRTAPIGPIGAYTWQKARIRLIGVDDRITGVVMANGDRPVLTNRYDAEPMTGWYYSENQAKATGQRPYYLPARHDPERSFWRGLAAVLPNVPQPPSTTDSGQPSRKTPGVVVWLSMLTARGLLDEDVVVRLHAVGMVYGTQSAVVSEIVDDAYSVAVAVLSTDHPELGELARWGVDVASRACWALGVFGENIAKSEVGDDPGDSGKTRMTAAKSDASAMGYATLDAPFRHWLSTLTTDIDVPSTRRTWGETVSRLVRGIALDLARNAPPQTIMQRPAHLMCVPIAERQFLDYLQRRLLTGDVDNDRRAYV